MGTIEKVAERRAGSGRERREVGRAAETPSILQISFLFKSLSVLCHLVARYLRDTGAIIVCYSRGSLALYATCRV